MYQIPLDAPSVANPPAIVRTILASGTATPTPDLHGFQKRFTKEPVLAQHGVGIAEVCHGGGIMTMRQAIQKLLPEGWTVYSRPGVLLGLNTHYSCKGGKPWTTALQHAIRNVGFHGAIYWGPNDMTVWVPAASPESSPDLSGYKPVALKPHIVREDTLTVGRGGKIVASLSQDTATMQTTAPLPSPSLSGATPVFLLNKGDLILTDLQKWAKQSGWTVIWQVPEDWQVPNTTSFSGDFQKAVSQVIQALSANGANVHAVFHTANNTVVVSGAGGGE